jgi:hypothetical protein
MVSVTELQARKTTSYKYDQIAAACGSSGLSRNTSLKVNLRELKNMLSLLGEMLQSVDMNKKEAKQLLILVRLADCKNKQGLLIKNQFLIDNHEALQNLYR